MGEAAVFDSVVISLAFISIDRLLHGVFFVTAYGSITHATCNQAGHEDGRIPILMVDERDGLQPALRLSGEEVAL